MERKCDGRTDCHDGCDEVHCKLQMWKSNEYQCKNLNCVPTNAVCDGQSDCLDDSDDGGATSVQDERDSDDSEDNEPRERTSSDVENGSNNRNASDSENEDAQNHIAVIRMMSQPEKKARMKLRLG